MSTDDLTDLPHVVIVESADGIRLVEFDAGQMLAAHGYASKVVAGDFYGRVIVAARVRTLQPLSYAKEHGT